MQLLPDDHAGAIVVQHGMLRSAEVKDGSMDPVASLICNKAGMTASFLGLLVHECSVSLQICRFFSYAAEYRVDP